MPPAKPTLRVGRYALFGEIASGGMATVYFGRLIGEAGFSRTVAIKRLHPQLAKDPDLAAMLADEARLAGRIHHPNVVPTLDVVSTDGELFLVLEYVHGESLSRLARATFAQETPIPQAIVAAIICGALHGLHAAHEAVDENGASLHIVHRDVSPQNIIVGEDGTPRVLDFGVAKAVGRSHVTRDGSVKGKLAYMPPEQLRAGAIDRRADIYAAGVVLWELFTGTRLFAAENEGATVERILHGVVDPPSARAPELPRAVDAVVMRALSRNATERFGTARQMALELEEATGGIASPAQVGEWVRGLAGDALAARTRALPSSDSDVPPETPELEVAPSVADEPMRSQMSSISVSMPTDDRQATKPDRARWPVAAAFVAGLAVATGAVLLSTRGSHESAPAGASLQPSTVLSTSADVTPADPVAVASAAPSSSAAPSASIAASASVAAAAHPPPGKRPPVRPPSQKCIVRTFVDNAGVKQYTEDCGKK
jgi:serine/threonine-protein kinase